ncbi:hypothetical protein AHIS1636_28420 [Arthrobacter mangrovi]|uniref:Uncharacterized protein n=1 Tax=Arthrobacter mangrovi TaxID=2966350 RepID=A0ABQ5MWU5_9MICC|nr:hypothetical protein AHIS1636_28420 [Arthrobacter mangrovi]
MDNGPDRGRGPADDVRETAWEQTSALSDEAVAKAEDIKTANQGCSEEDF